MQRRTFLPAAAAALLAAGCAMPPAARPPRGDAAAEVRAAETAFARSMADRDLAAFASHVADDAVFVNGGQPLRGKAAVLAHWRRFFEGPSAPFAWQPEIVEVLAGGDLAHSEGPVTSPQGRVIARFVSTWRREADGRWRVVFDNGHEVCDCAPRR